MSNLSLLYAAVVSPVVKYGMSIGTNSTQAEVAMVARLLMRG